LSKMSGCVWITPGKCQKLSGKCTKTWWIPDIAWCLDNVRYPPCFCTVSGHYLDITTNSGQIPATFFHRAYLRVLIH
jgi:hypothetical protein